MKKRLMSILLSGVMVLTLAACGGNSGAATIENTEVKEEAAETEAEAPAEDAGEDFHIGIVTGSVSQSEDDRRGAEAFQAKYGEENVILAVYFPGQVRRGERKSCDLS